MSKPLTKAQRLKKEAKLNAFEDTIIEEVMGRVDMIREARNYLTEQEFTAYMKLRAELDLPLT